MADITSPQAVTFCNEQIRPLADKLAQAYYLAKMVKDAWYSNNLGALFPTGQGPVVDGSATDGRNVLMADDVTLLIARCEDLINDYQASNNLKLNTVLKPAVNVRP